MTAYVTETPHAGAQLSIDDTAEYGLAQEALLVEEVEEIIDLVRMSGSIRKRNAFSGSAVVHDIWKEFIGETIPGSGASTNHIDPGRTALGTNYQQTDELVG